MDTSWRPTLKARSYYPPKVVEQSQSPNLAQTESAPGLTLIQSKINRNGRVWGSKKAACAPQQDADAADSMIQIDANMEKAFQPQCSDAHSYAKEEFLLVRQRMMDRGAIEEAVSGSGRLLCRQHQSNEAQVHLAVPRDKFLKTLSTGSVCSTTDALSEASEQHEGSSLSEEQDATSSSITELPVVEAVQVTLRAGAPEFVPCATTSASETVNRAVPGHILSSMPVCQPHISPIAHGTPEFLCSDAAWSANADLFGGSLGSCMEDTVNRYLEWQQYSGLTTRWPDGPPHSFRHANAYSCSIAELFAMAKPGQLFGYKQL